MRNVVFCAALKTLTDETARRQDALVTFVPQQIQSDRIVGVDEPFSRLKASILKASHDEGTASHLGLHGQGGAGKTLLAQMLHNDSNIIEAYGSGAVMWITVGLDGRVRDLYKSMATFLPDGGAFEKHYGHRGLKDQRTYLWNAFEKRRVFLILDDVWQEKCEENHAMMYWLNIATAPGSATLITTRNYEVLSRVYAESEVVLSLSDEDSWTLFCSHAFHDVALPATVSEQVARDICRECGGLPLAVIVVGSAMMDKVEAGEWNSVLCYLKRSKAIIGSRLEGELFGRLRLSYDMLESDVLKTCFLYFAAFPEDYKVRTTKLFSMWISEGLVDGEDDAWAHLKVLVKRSLIHWNCDRVCVQVHDILRDLALVIIDTAEAGECGYDCFFQSGSMLRTFPTQKLVKAMRRMSLMNTGVPKDLHSLEAPEVQVCLLSGIVEVDSEIEKCFTNSNMSSLRYLDLSHNCFDNLMWAWVLESMGEWKFLVYLDVSECVSLEQFPESMGELKVLVHLDLFDCSSLKQLPEFLGELKCLVYLNLSRCESLKQLPESMGKLKSLAHLDLSWCRSLKQLPVSICKLKYLVHLDLSYCDSLEQLPESMGELMCLVHLNVSYCISLKELPKSMGKLQRLVHLDLSGCISLQQLPESMGKLVYLATLYLDGCSSLQELPESMGKLKCLAHLDLYNCSSLQELPKSMGELKSLADLDLSRCISLKQLPESMGELKCLTYLNLAWCTPLMQLPESMDNNRSYVIQR